MMTRTSKPEKKLSDHVKAAQNAVELSQKHYDHGRYGKALATLERARTSALRSQAMLLENNEPLAAECFDKVGGLLDDIEGIIVHLRTLVN